jgi:hypothetical protein
MAGLNIPFPSTPLPPQVADTAYELWVQRRITHAFIRAEPVDIGLSRRSSSRTALGGVMKTFSRQLPTQTFKLIMQSPAGASIEQRSDDGTERRVDYVLLGEWDADVEVGDYWDDESGERNEVTSMIPYNGYETRANVEGYGKKPLNG